MAESYCMVSVSFKIHNQEDQTTKGGMNLYLQEIFSIRKFVSSSGKAGINYDSRTSGQMRMDDFFLYVNRGPYNNSYII